MQKNWKIFPKRKPKLRRLKNSIKNSDKKSVKKKKKKQTEMTNGSWCLAKKEYNYNSVTKKRETQISMSQTQHKLKVKS